MLLKGADILNGNFETVRADIAVENGKITAAGHGLSGSGETIDLDGCVVVPGFVDIHIHGCSGYDVCDATREALSGMAAFLAERGVTSFCPTTMTMSPEEIEASLLNVKRCMDNPPEGASIIGVNMEGPYISAARKGAQKLEYIKGADWKEFKRYYDLSGGIIRLVDIAPERPGSGEFIEHVKKYCNISIAHTEANYDEAAAAFRRGVSHATHLFNAMPGIDRREPGTVGAVFDNGGVMAELICDGFHVHPAVLRTAFRLLGNDRAIIISDSMRAAGLADGVYDLGGQLVTVCDGKARLADGAIAGSTTNLHEEIRNLVRFGVPFSQVIKSATLNPAKSVGTDSSIGSIEAGKNADLVAMDRNLNLKLVVARGNIIKNCL